MNIHDLAKHLNISIGTISRALNGKADVNAETRKRVIKAAQEFGYAPNQSGRSLRQGTTGLVGFMVLTNRDRETRGEAFFISVFGGMQSYLYSCGRDLVVHFGSKDEDALAHMRRIVERRIVDGLIISNTTRIDKRIDYLAKGKVPFIAFGRSENAVPHSWLDLDFEGTATKAIDHLVSLGHTHIAIASASDDVNYGHIWEEACQAAMAKNGLRLTEDLILREPLTEFGGYRVGERLLAMAQRPTAIALVDNTMAIGLYHKFQDVRLVPGKDIAVVGFDESPNGEFLRPSLTQFKISLHELGWWLGKHIVDLIEAKAAGTPVRHHRKIWPMDMVVAESSMKEHRGKA